MQSMQAGDDTFNFNIKDLHQTCLPFFLNKFQGKQKQLASSCVLKRDVSMPPLQYL